MTATLPGAGYIPLKGRNGKAKAWAVVDLADFPRISRSKWHLNTRGYACRQVPREGGGQWTLSMHRAVLGLGLGDAPGLVVDHVDHAQLNNRRSNLRLVTCSANQQNRLGPRVDASSSARGVSPAYRGDRWKARAQVDGERVYLGYFRSVEDAEAAARAWRLEHMPYSPD